MNKFTTILILSLLAVSFAVDENCKDHPWAKRNVLEKLEKIIPPAANDADYKAVKAIFNNASTATASTDITDADHPALAAWKADGKTCCTKAIYDQIVKIPVLLDSFAAQNENDFVRVIAGLAKGIKKCGGKKGKKGTDGEEHDIGAITPLDLLRRIKVPSATPGEQEVDNLETPAFGSNDATTAAATDATAATVASGSVRRFLQAADTTATAEKFGIEYLVDYYKAKAAIIKAWVQFQRGNLMFLCRLPSKAVDSLKTDALKVDQTSYDATVKAYKDALLAIRTATGGLANVIKFAFRAFGDSAKCAAAADKVLKTLAKAAICKKGECKQFFTGIKPRPLAIGFLNKILGQNKGQNPDFEADRSGLKEKPPARMLQTTDEAEPSAVTGDTNAAKSVSATGDDQLTGGSPYTADGKCKTGESCGDFTPIADAQYNEQGAVTKDGKALPAETAATTSSIIVSAFAVVLGLFALLF